LVAHSGVDPAWLPVILWSIALFAGMNFACMAVMPALSSSYRKLNAQDQGEWITRCSSTVNAFVTGFLCLYTLLTDAHVWADGVWYRPHFTMYAIAIAAGYFYVDFAFITYYRIPPLLPIITHHLLAGWGFTGGLGPIGRFPLFGSLLLLTEFTTPFNNFSWFLEHSGMAHTRLYRVNFAVFTALWIVFRLLNWFVIFYQWYVFWDDFRASNGYMQTILVLNFVFLFLLNWVYFFIAGPFLPYYGIVGATKTPVEIGAGTRKSPRTNKKKA
jgi:hypothetical protein